MIPTLLVQTEFDWSMWAVPFTPGYLIGTLCSMLVGTACGVLGCFVVLRRMALIGDALSHAVLPGVVIAFILTNSTGIFGLLIGALAAGLVTAVLINLVSRYSRAKEDSAIGIVFTALFALGIILISKLPRGTHFDLTCFLFGDPLAVLPPDLVMMAVIAPLVLVLVVLFYYPLKLVSFDPVVAAAMGVPVALVHYLLMGMLSATVVTGLKTTGVVLVVAMVITPASAAYQLTNRFWLMLVLSAVFGAVSAAVGMSIAFVSDWPSGPPMVLVAAAIFVVAMLLSPSHGVVFDRLRRWRLGRHIAAEDVLKAVYHLREGDRQDELVGQPFIERVAAITYLASAAVHKLAGRLSDEGLITAGDDGFVLTDRGRQRALEMVRAHRLWESYLAEHANVAPDDLHAQAEVLEHAHELADEVDAELGHPTRDPHGEEIPTLQPPA